MKPSLAVCTASGRDPKWQYTYDMVRLISGLVNFCEKATYQIELGYATDYARNRLARMCLKDGFSHLLFVDDDMGFPGDSAERLIAHDLDIVGANYTKRQFPVIPVAQGSKGMVFSRDRAGLEEVEHTGTGLLLIKTDVFKRLPEPWFETRFFPATDGLISDDVYFCNLARAHGLKVWVDHDLSQGVSHIGDFGYHHGLTMPPMEEPKSLVERCTEALS